MMRKKRSINWPTNSEPALCWLLQQEGFYLRFSTSLKLPRDAACLPVLIQGNSMTSRSYCLRAAARCISVLSLENCFDSCSRLPFLLPRDPETALSMRRVPLSDGVGELLVRTEADAPKQIVRISLTACLQTPCVLRWGMVDIMGRRQTELQAAAEKSGAPPPTATSKGGRYQWICPPPEVRPPHTIVADPQR